MSTKLRAIVQSRRQIPDAVAQSLRPLEQSVHDAAVQASAFTTLLLTSHAEAALPTSAGVRAIRLANEASQLATESRAKLAEARAELMSILDDFWVAGPACPPNQSALPALRRVS